MIIMKFGGTSVGTADAVRSVLNIVRGRLDEHPVLVVSALSGVTNKLEELGRTAPLGETDTGFLVERHQKLLGELGLPEDLLDGFLSEMADLVRGMKLVSEASPRARDLLLSLGERCSVRLLAAYFSDNGVPAQPVDAFDLGLRTDSNFGRARPLPDDGRIAENLARVEGVAVVTGYLGADDKGDITTLGRNGSDFSAALFGNALNAREIQVWTDVDGVMTADPALVAGARSIPTMSFGEAGELAYYGGKVLHPATIQPAMEKSIPVRVLNTHYPDSPGTVILQEYDAPDMPVRAIVHKPGVYLINLVAPPMLQQHGFLAKVFNAAAKHEVDVDLVATTEVSITMTSDRGDGMPGFCRDLEELGDVTVDTEHSMLGVVGQGISHMRGFAAQVLGTLAEEEIRVRAISQGAIKVALGMVINNSDLSKAVNALHNRFFG